MFMQSFLCLIMTPSLLFPFNMIVISVNILVQYQLSGYREYTDLVLKINSQSIFSYSFNFKNKPLVLDKGMAE